MTSKELRRWLERKGCLYTMRGPKYLLVSKIADRYTPNRLNSVVCAQWGMADWGITFSLQDEKPAVWKKLKCQESNVTTNKDGSRMVVSGDTSYFVPAGKSLPSCAVTDMKEIRAPLQSFRPLEANIQLLTHFVNDQMIKSLL